MLKNADEGEGDRGEKNFHQGKADEGGKGGQPKDHC